MKKSIRRRGTKGIWLTPGQQRSAAADDHKLTGFLWGFGVAFALSAVAGFFANRGVKRRLLESGVAGDVVDAAFK